MGTPAKRLCTGISSSTAAAAAASEPASRCPPAGSSRASAPTTTARKAAENPTTIPSSRRKPAPTGVSSRSPRHGHGRDIHIVFEAAMTDTTRDHQRPVGRAHAPGRVLSLQLRHHEAGEARPQRNRSARLQGIGQQERESRRAPRRLLDLRRHLSARCGWRRGRAITSSGPRSMRAPTAASTRARISIARARQARGCSAQVFDAAGKPVGDAADAPK